LLLVVSTDFAHQVVERFVDVDPSLSGCFDEPAREMVGQITTLCTGKSVSSILSLRQRDYPEAHTLLTDSSIHIQVALVADDDHREIVLVLHPQNLLLERSDFDETRSAGDRVHKEETFAGTHVLLAHCRILFLTGGIQHIKQSNFIVDDTLLAV
jgi:hypothetical protein